MTESKYWTHEPARDILANTSDDGLVDYITSESQTEIIKKHVLLYLK